MGGFVDALKKVGVNYDQDTMRQLFAKLDINGNGTVELPEFEAVVSEWRASNPSAPTLVSSARSHIDGMYGPAEPDNSETTLGEALGTRRRPIEAAWSPIGVPRVLLVLSEWPTPLSLVTQLGCWYDLMLALELGADISVALSASARRDFLAQVNSGELSFTLDQRPRWNRARPGLYSSGPVAQAIDVRMVASRWRT